MDLREQLRATLGQGYELERELTGGGMSRVFVADERALGRKIVVKVLSPDLAAGVSADRFAREIRVAAQLQQANIVPVLTAGETNGLPYYTMPYVDGQSVRHRLENGPLPIADAINILRDVARALAYAHERGIVHRDIKPDNVLLSGDAAVVTDFGIAKAISASRTVGTDMTLTSAGAVVGTPAYMAPEQALGDPATDHRADLYAFGCLAFELLAGVPPFQGRTVQQLVAAHVNEKPPNVSSLRADTPPDFADLVMQCLDKNPNERPQSARAILSMLDAVSSSTRISPARRATRGTKRLLGALVVAVVVAAFGFWRARGSATASTGPHTLAVMPFANVGRDTTQQYLADGIAIDLTNALSKVPGFQVTSRSLAFSYKNNPTDVRTIGSELHVDAVLEGSIQRANGRIRVTAQLTRSADGVSLWSNSYEREAKDLFAVQDDITMTIINELRPALGGGASRPRVAGTTNFEAYESYLRGVYLLEHRGAGVARSIVFFNDAIAKDSGFARAYGAQSEAYGLLPYFNETSATSVESLAVAAAERALALDSTTVEAHIGLALVRDHAYRWQDAEVEYRRAIAVDSNSAIAQMQYGRHLMHRGRLDEALRHLRRATQLDPVAGTAFVWLSHVYSILGQHDSATAIGRRAREIDPGLMLTRTILASDAVAAGRPEEARTLASNVVATPPWRGQAAYALGMVGDTAEARRIIHDLKAMPRDTWMVHTALTYAYFGLRDTASALTELEAALRAREITPKWETFSDRLFDPVRASPRWAAIVRGFGLDERVMTIAVPPHQNSR